LRGGKSSTAEKKGKPVGEVDSVEVKGMADRKGKKRI